MKIAKRIAAALAAVALVAALIAVSASATEYITTPVNEFSEGSGNYYFVLSVGQSVRVAGSAYEDPGEADSAEAYTGIFLRIPGFVHDTEFDYGAVSACFTVGDGAYETENYITISAATPGGSYYYYRISGTSDQRKLFVFVYDEMEFSDVSPTVGDLWYAKGQADSLLSFPADKDESYKLGYDAGYSYGRIAGMSDGYECGRADGYSDGLEKGAISSEAYKRGYDAGFNSVIQTSDGAAVSGMFSGIFGAFFDGYRTIANGISVGGISVGAVVSTCILIGVVVVVVRFILRFVKS